MEDYVENFYSNPKVNERFINSRAGYTWKSITEFINSFSKNSKLLDAGCGSCRNFIREDCDIIGFDNCSEFVNKGKKKGFNIIKSDIRNIKLESEKFDGVYCVAVLHHLSNIKDRKQAINELIRVAKPNCKIFIQVWANTVKKNKRFININNNDYFVTWVVNKDLKLKRYIHFFEKDELIKLIDTDKVDIENIDNERDNWTMILRKL